MARRKVIVLGAGAAGLMAAGQAAKAGAGALILEKMDRPGIKLSITGKGRCNLTNTAPFHEFLKHFGKGARFLRPSLSKFGPNDLRDFFQSLGVPTVVERGGRVFPESNLASDVVEALVSWVQDCGVSIKTKCRVKNLLIEGDGICGVRDADGGEYRADCVILAMGGASYPGTGSSGDGFRLAKEAGHPMIEMRPALVPLVAKGKIPASLQGLSLKNVSVKILVEGKKKAGAFGELLFTHFGLSGPTILTLSLVAVDALREGKRVAASIDLKPALSHPRLDARLLRDLDAHGKRKFQTMLQGLLPRKLIPVCMDLTGIPPEKIVSQIDSSERKRLRTWLKDFRLEITGHRGFREAVITAGGVDTRKLDPKTMSSRLMKGLFFAGEVLDLQGDTGGYNLQAAFTTGLAAGLSAVKGN